MRKKLILIILVFSFLINSVSAYSVTVSPTSIDKEYTLGSTPLNNVTLTFTSQETNATYDLSISKTGTASNLISLSTTTLNFIDGSTTTLDVGFNIPETTPLGIYMAIIDYQEGSIPVYINVKKSVSAADCRIIIPFAEYIYSISRKTKPYQEIFSFRISSKCNEGMDITDIKLSGVILTEAGYSPLRLISGIPTGFFEGGDLLSLTTEFDVSGLERGTYQSYILIMGNDVENEESISASMKFKITVVGTASPVGDIDTLDPPTWEAFPQELVLNNSYVLIARNLNPNLEIVIEPNEFIYGEFVETIDNSWRYTFHPTMIGNTKIRYYATYKGGIIGTVQEQEVRITSTQPEVSGVNLTFQFFPSLSELTEGKTITILVKDSKNGNIVSNFKLYKNGVLLEGNSFVVETGTEYSLQATSPGYNSLEQKFSISKKTITISFSKNPIKINETVTITTDPIDAELFLNGSSVGKNFTSDISGTYIFTSTKENYLNVSATLTVESDIGINYITLDEEIKINQVIAIELNEEGTYRVFYNKDINDENSEDEIILEGIGSLFEFIPEKKGVYWINVNDKNVWSKEIKGGFFSSIENWFSNLSGWWFLFIIIIAGVVIFYFKYLREEEVGEPGGSSEGGFDVGG